jgi:hypothetical protein
MSSYCDPTTVHGPRDRVSNLHIVYDGGAGDFAVAQLDWDGEPVIGIRWNGDLEKPLGTPRSFGHPYWLITPHWLSDAVLRRAREVVTADASAR